MTRIPYDQTAKQLLDGVLERAGRAEVQHEVSNDPQWIDVWFERDATKPLPAGLFGRMVRESCAFEVFHGIVNTAEALDCLAKQLGVYRRRRRRRSVGVRAEVPSMWLVTNDRPRSVLKELLAEPLEGWPTGFYRMKVPALPLYVVTARDLPRVRETLVLRLMGSKKVLRDALEELGTLPESAWERTAATGAVGVLHSLASKASTLSNPTEKAIVMNATALYEQIKEEGREEGRRRGREEGRAEGKKGLLRRMLGHRFGELPPTVVARIDAANSSQLDRWGERLVTATTLNEVFKHSRT